MLELKRFNKGVKITRTQRATMKDVAGRAGVTIGTVSHVINHTASISAETTRRVMDAIEELNYVPNSLARNMRTKTNHRIGLMIPNLTNNFYAKIASSFVDLADQYKYTVFIMGYEYSLDRERDGLRSLMEYNVGTVVIANGFGDEQFIRELLEKGIHVILADRRTDIEGVSYVEYDNRKVYRDVIRLLKEKGYRSIGYISEPLDLINISDRYYGCKEAMEEQGYELKPEHTYISDRFCLDNMRNGYLYMKDLLERKARQELPDALIASSDLLAIGIMRAFVEAGLHVPEDIGVVGCDNLQISGYTQPRLTTVAQDREQLSREIWRMILAKDDGEKVANVTLPQELIIRESC